MILFPVGGYCTSMADNGYAQASSIASWDGCGEKYPDMHAVTRTEGFK